jgi:N-glycosylase/DNA lyase
MQWDTLDVKDFDLAATLDSGQTFHWHRDGALFWGTIGDVAVALRQSEPTKLEVSRGHASIAAPYLGLDHDLDAIRRTLPKRDKPLQRALKFAPGLRIMHQPKWECLATFITSSLKQVPHIRKISLTLRERFGERVNANGPSPSMWAYPTPQAIADAGEKALRECGLGYRAKFLHLTASKVAAGEVELEAIAQLDDDGARQALCGMPGVGEKIANCVLLFAYGRLGAFPVDVWIERALRELYFAGTKEEVTSKELRKFAQDHFGPYRGYAQQWLFHHARTGGIFAKGKVVK